MSRRHHHPSGASSSALPLRRALERRRIRSDDYAKLWMRNGGLTHAQAHLISSPRCILFLIVFSVLVLALIPLSILFSTLSAWKQT